MNTINYPKTALVLSGGGARGAFQAGVLKAITEIASENELQQNIRVITGVSAGAINATYLASEADNLHLAANNLCNIWSELSTDKVFKTDAFTAGSRGFKLLIDATMGSWYKKKLAKSLLDTSPLYDLLKEKINYEKIEKVIKQKNIDSFGITAVNYNSNTSETFYISNKQIAPWQRTRRIGKESQIGVEHVMASSAIPLFFPPIQIGHDNYGDGCLRNTAPLSPAIHLGADQLLVISVRRPDNLNTEQKNIEPTFARVLGLIMNALMLDAVENDMERMIRINSTIERIDSNKKENFNLRPINFLWLRPQRDLGNLASENADKLPSVIKYLLGGLGSPKEASELTSYLLFEPNFLKTLIYLGYERGQQSKLEIIDFLKGKKINQEIEF